MATPDKATLQVSVNAGPPQSGGVIADFGDTFVASLVDPSGVRKAEYRLWEYPEGFDCPDGWTAMPGGLGYRVITQNGAPAPAVQLPALPLWGKFFLSVEVNDRVRNGAVVPELYDESTAIKVADPSGVEDIGFMESTQFDTKRSWAGPLKQSLRGVSALLATPTRTILSTTHTFELTDANKQLRSASSDPTTFTIPPQSSVAWPPNARIPLLQLGTGKLSVAGGTGVTIRVELGYNAALRDQYTPGMLERIDEDEWLMYGALEVTT